MSALFRRLDPEIATAIENEKRLQAQSLDLNAASSFTSPAVLEAQGSVFGSRTLEGYPGSRFHAGHVWADEVERLAVSRAMGLFQAEHANVQPHSGVNANFAVYFATLEPGDAILGMDLESGGHLSHGRKGTFSAKFFSPSSYGIDPRTGLIDYDAARATALKVRPRMIVCGASSYPRAIDFARFRDMADETGALLLADIAHFAGLVAGGVYPSPVPYADFVTFTGYKTLSGARGGTILCRAIHAKKIDAAVFPGVQGSMHLHHMAAKAVTFRLASMPEFRIYAARVIENARALARALEEKGHCIVTNGTDTHIVLVDLRDKGISGKEAEERLEAAGIHCNKNAVPMDPRGPSITSGIRLGTAALTGRGLKPADMPDIAGIIDSILSEDTSPGCVGENRERVRAICRAHPLPWDLEDK
jgi:glycine hydroxymethyltransferase